MKYKEIKLGNDKSVLVDESDTTKLIKGDWHIEKGHIINQFPDYLTDLDECKKIVATINHSIDKDVPMVTVEDVTGAGVLIKNLEIEINKTPTGYLRNLLCDANILIQSQQKNVYSEDDMGNLWDFCAFNKGTFEKFIQSLNREYVELETEEKQRFEKDKTKRINPLNGVFYETTIKTARNENDQLVAYMK